MGGVHGEPATTAADVRFGTKGHTRDHSSQTTPSTADGPGVNGRATRMYLVAGALAVCCYVLVPGVAGNRWLFEAVGLSAELVER